MSIVAAVATFGGSRSTLHLCTVIPHASKPGFLIESATIRNGRNSFLSNRYNFLIESKIDSWAAACLD
jgi:hypothetical protein